jgi:hypothetical protein
LSDPAGSRGGEDSAPAGPRAWRAYRFYAGRFTLWSGTLLLLLSLAGAAEIPRTVEPPVKIEVLTKPIPAFDMRDPSQRKFGELLFRGGLELSSPYREFGGVSALRVATNGANFIATTDKGRWLRGRILYENSRPFGIADAEMAPILGPDGRTLAARGWYDTESIAEDGGTLYLGIERVHQIVRFNYGKDGLLARGQPIPVPPALKKLPTNKSLEALVFVPKPLPLAGTLIALSEQGLDAAGNIRGFLIGGPTPGEFTIQRFDEFDISDAAITPRGDLLVLDRRLSWTRGLAIRIRRIPLASVKPGALLDGPVLLEADMGYQLDNMEGLSVHRDGNGEIVLTLISDDNFFPLQRTLLLQFTLIEE